MKWLLRPRILLCLLILCWNLRAGAQSVPPVSKIVIKHVGPPAVSNSQIRSNIHVKVGDPFSHQSVDQDVRNLYATGYFNNVQVLEDLGASGYTLTYMVQGKPVLTDIRFSGNKKYSNKKLLKKVSSKVGEPLDELKLFEDSQAIEQMYQKAGYQKTTVKAVPDINEKTGRGTVTFVIHEAPKIRIVDVQFIGAKAFSQRKLRHVIKTRRHWFFSWLTGSGKLKEDQFEDDKDRLADFYHAAGYIDFQIKDVKFVYPKKNRLIIKFIIFEGNQYKVGSMAFKGNKLFTSEQLTNGVESGGVLLKPKMEAGSIFTPKGLAQDIDAIKDIYGTKGYIDAQVVALKNPNIAKGTMDLVFQIDEGEQSYIEKVVIKGNTKTKDRVIRRELAVYPGEVFDRYRVKVSKERLEGLNYFSKVETDNEPTDVPHHKNLVIDVEEKNTGNLNFGAGISSIDGLVGFAELTQGNFDLFNPPYFTGGGEKFRLRAQYGTQTQDYIMSFDQPWFLGRRLRFGVDLFHRDLNYLSSVYSEKETGGRLRLEKSLTQNLAVGASYTLESIGIDVNPDYKNPTYTVVNEPGRGQHFIIARPRASDELLAENGQRLVSKIGTSVSYDTRDNVLMPTRGYRTELSTEVAGGPLGGDTDIYKLDARSAWFFPGFFDKNIIEFDANAGVVDSYGSTHRVPLFDRWFLGGLNSLRGYRYRDVAPRDVNGEPIGGGTYWSSTLQYSFPIIERLRFELFYDIGNVYPGAYSFQPQNPDNPLYNDDWGVGIILTIPHLGPLRLEYGIPITHDKQLGSGGRFQFGVGYQREF